jgi:hypothetical protein
MLIGIQIEMKINCKLKEWKCCLPIFIDASENNHGYVMNFMFHAGMWTGPCRTGILWVTSKVGASINAVGWGTMLQVGTSPVKVPDEVNFFNLPNPSSRTMAPGSTQPLTEMSIRNLPGGKMRPARRADNLAAICEPNIASTSHNPVGLHGLLQG